MYFGELVFESDEQGLSLTTVKSMISSHPGRDLLKSVLKVRNALVKAEWVEKEELSAICIKAVVKGKKRAESTERGRVHDEE